MKKRVVSGLIMAIIVAAVVALGALVHVFFVVAFLAILAAVATYELLRNATGLKNKAANIIASITTALFVIIYNVPFRRLLFSLANEVHKSSGPRKIEKLLVLIGQSGTYCLMIAYVLLIAVMVVFNHKDFGLTRIMALLCAPRVFGFAFSCIDRIFEHRNGIYYLLLLLTFSCVCDMGAYFIGINFGKHKLCPEISPKKTVEGLIGGVVIAVAVTAVLIFTIGNEARAIHTCILAIPLCLLGVVGDLFASVIKRSAGIKDYGNLIPGHGGVLDRFDSILLIAPALLIAMTAGLA